MGKNIYQCGEPDSFFFMSTEITFYLSVFLLRQTKVEEICVILLEEHLSPQISSQISV